MNTTSVSPLGMDISFWTAVLLTTNIRWVFNHTPSGFDTCRSPRRLKNPSQDTCPHTLRRLSSLRCRFITTRLARNISEARQGVGPSEEVARGRLSRILIMLHPQNV